MSVGEEKFLLNVNDGLDTIHRLSGLTESCNTDDIVGRQKVDRATAVSMVARDQAVWCLHCNKERKEAHL